MRMKGTNRHIRALSVLLCLVMVLTSLTVFPLTASAASNVAYVDASGTTLICQSAIVVDGTNTNLGTGSTESWYVLTQNVNVTGYLNIAGTVNLILQDGCTLTTSNCVVVQTSGAKLVIWGGEKGTGTLNAKGGYCEAGIQLNGKGTLIVNSGTVVATGNNYGAGIGGGQKGAGGTVIINGGTVTATGNGGGAGIGGGIENAGGTITINGGTVTATGSNGGAGIGSGQNGGSGGSFSTGTDGNAVIVASSISDTSNQNGWNGIINYTMYGDAVTPTENFEIPAGKTLTIKNGQTLTVDTGITLTNNGTIVIDEGGELVVNGELINNGTITDNGTISGSGKVRNKVTISFSAGDGSGTMNSVAAYTTDTYTLPECTFTAPIGYEFKTWEVNNTEYGVSESFTVTGATTVKAVWKAKIYTVSLEKNGGTINNGNVTQYTYGEGATLPTDVTKENLTFGGWYENSDFSGDPVTQIGTTDTGAKTYYARWTASVSFDAGEGTGTMNSAVVTEGADYTLPANGFTAPLDHEFDAWSVGGEKKAVGDSITVSADTTVTAEWKLISPSYTVTIPATATPGEAFTVSAEATVLRSTQTLTVAITGTSGTDNAFTLKNAQNVELGYTLRNGETVIGLNDKLLALTDKQTGSVNIDIVPDKAKYSGDYTGTVIFTIALEEVVNE